MLHTRLLLLTSLDLNQDNDLDVNLNLQCSVNVQVFIQMSDVEFARSAVQVAYHLFCHLERGPPPSCSIQYGTYSYNRQRRVKLSMQFPPCGGCLPSLQVPTVEGRFTIYDTIRECTVPSPSSSRKHRAKFIREL